MNGERREATIGADETPLSLLERLRHRSDDSSWRRLSDLYVPLVRHRLSRQGVPPADVDDLTQEILMVVLREVAEFDHSGRKGAFRAWLRTIVVNRLRGYWRNKRTRPAQAAEEELDRIADPDGDVARAWDAEHDEFMLRGLLDLIKPEFSAAAWHAFHRQSVDGLSASETAAELGVSANAVLIAKSRVLRRLRQEAIGLID